MPQNILEQLTHSLALAAHIPEAEIEIAVPIDSSHGDLTTNIAMKLAAVRQQAPLKIAQGISQALARDEFVKETFAFEPETAVKAPGFINFFYQPKYLKVVLNDVFARKQYGARAGRGKRVVVEYSSPNTNKPLHLGHLRNDALGMALANILTFLGQRVTTTSVINDRGIHIMRSLLAYQKWGEGKTPKSENKKGDHFVGDYYVKFNHELKNNETLKDESYALLKRWEENDREVRKLWQRMNTWVYAGWRETYALFGSKFNKLYYESKLYDKGRELVAQGLKAGVFSKDDAGAVVVDLAAYNLGGRETGNKVLLRPDGTTVYITQDLYLAHKRYQDYKFDKLFYVVADEQNYHFKVLFKIFELLGYTWAKNCRHYAYGMVDLPSGKMKSREGTVVDADDLIYELTDLARQEILARRDDIGKQEVEEIAPAVALAAIKYWFLKSNPKSRITFDPKQSIDFEGNTGPYLLYTYVRLRGIMRKAGKIPRKSAGRLGESELALVRSMAAWPFVLNDFTNHYNPNMICEFLYKLASELNTYYQTVPVLKGDDALKAQRLQIIAAGSRLIKLGLDLLNIRTVERM